MTKPIVISKNTWNNLIVQIKEHYPPSVSLIRDRMKSVLGFTPREHTEWEYRDNDYTAHPTTTVRLDFFDEKKRVMFLLKYGDIIHEKVETK